MKEKGELISVEPNKHGALTNFVRAHANFEAALGAQEVRRLLPLVLAAGIATDKKKLSASFYLLRKDITRRLKNEGSRRHPLQDFLLAHADFDAAPVKEEIERLFRLAKQCGLKTTPRSLRVTFLALKKKRREELEGRKADSPAPAPAGVAIEPSSEATGASEPEAAAPDPEPEAVPDRTATDVSAPAVKESSLEAIRDFVAANANLKAPDEAMEIARLCGLALCAGLSVQEPQIRFAFFRVRRRIKTKSGKPLREVLDLGSAEAERRRAEVRSMAEAVAQGKVGQGKSADVEAFLDETAASLDQFVDNFETLIHVLKDVAKTNKFLWIRVEELSQRLRELESKGREATPPPPPSSPDDPPRSTS